MGIFTFNRTPNYYDWTIRQMVQKQPDFDGKIHIYISQLKQDGSDFVDAPLLDLGFKNYTKTFFTKHEKQKSSGALIHTLVIQNQKFLRDFLNSNCDYAIGFEDDLVISHNYLLYNDLMVRKVFERYQTKKVLISPYSSWKTDKGFGLEIQEMPKNFHGTQMIVYSRDLAKDILEYMDTRYWQEHHFLPYDIMLNNYIQNIDLSIPFVSYHYSPVQHNGNISSGLGGGHTTPNFDENMINSLL